MDISTFKVMTAFQAPYSYMGATVSLQQQRAKNTFKYLHPEVQRRFIYLQLLVLEGGVAQIGVGTGQRVQPANQANHAEPGNSNHEDFPANIDPPATPVNGAVAIDVVGSPTHEAGWTEMEKRLAQCGFTSFVIPQIKANWSTYYAIPRAYTGDWDRPHIQPIEIPYARSYRATPWPLKRWDIPPQYDIEHPSFGKVPTPTIPPSKDDNVQALVIKGDQAPSYWAWSESGVVGVPSLEWAAWGVEYGLYRNAEPVVFPQGHVDALVAAQAER